MLSGTSWISRMGVALRLNSITWLMTCIYLCISPCKCVNVNEHALGGQRSTWVSFLRCLSTLLLPNRGFLIRPASKPQGSVCFYFPSTGITTCHYSGFCCFNMDGLNSDPQACVTNILPTKSSPQSCIMERQRLALCSPSTKTK